MTENYVEEMKKLCQCGHSRNMHFHGFAVIPPGQSPPISKKDAECRADNCKCMKYESVEHSDVSSGATTTDT